jgi:hypothetical protein
MGWELEVSLTAATPTALDEKLTGNYGVRYRRMSMVPFLSSYGDVYALKKSRNRHK